MSNTSDFIIKNGIMQKYVGQGGDVVVPDGVTCIGAESFIYCRTVVNVTLPDTVETVERSAFEGCSMLRTVSLSENLVYIGAFAFCACFELEGITIPAKVWGIGKSAFVGCNNLKTVLIPDRGCKYAEDSFPSDAVLTKYHVNNDNDLDKAKARDSICDYEIEYKKTKKYLGAGGNVTVPEGIVSIGARSFVCCTTVVSVTLPNTVESIEESAFEECRGLRQIVIPDSITRIGIWAFKSCRSLEKITIPNSVSSIGEGAFRACESLKDITLPSGLTYIDRETFLKCSGLTCVTIPDSVTDIWDDAFMGCTSLTSVIIPKGVKKIWNRVFYNCPSLTSFIVENPACTFGNEVFGKTLPEGLASQIETLLPHFSVLDIKTYVLNKPTWDKLSSDTKATVFITKQGKSLEEPYRKLISKDDAAFIGNKILKLLDSSSKDCTIVMAFLTILRDKVGRDQAKALYEKLKTIKAAAKTVAKIEADPKLMEWLGKTVKIDDSLPEAEQKVASLLVAEKRSPSNLKTSIQEMYGLASGDFPKVQYKDGSDVSALVLSWLLTAHERYEANYKGKKEIRITFEKAGIRPEAENVLTYIDGDSFQKGLLELAERQLKYAGKTKEKFIAYPICRYADAETMAKLVARASQWGSPKDDPLSTFIRAALYNSSRAAIMLAADNDCLSSYARIHNQSEDVLRDRYFSDVGLMPDGTKQYDLGTTVVTAVLQPDFSYLICLPNGKTAKSLPKKIADPDKYEAANDDFSDMRKRTKKILKDRFNILFSHFLDGHERPAAEWKEAYCANPLLKHAASIVVWVQGVNTFVLGKDGVIDSNEQPYAITDAPIKVAHPMEMQQDDVLAWQKFFTSHGLKQPFLQIWEPIHKAEEIKRNRYADCKIPCYRFLHQGKHGIWTWGSMYDGDLEVEFKDCKGKAKPIDNLKYTIDPNDPFVIKSFGFQTYNRQVNHIVAYLDRVTVWDRVRNDDLTVMELMDRFTLAQITEFIASAQEANATNVLAALLDYKNARFADFDPMAEFTLDW